MVKSAQRILSLTLLATIFFGCEKATPYQTPVDPNPDPIIDPIVDPIDDSDKKPSPGEYCLPVFETTDIHGHILENASGTIHYRLAYIADKVRDVRFHDGAYDKDRALLLDGGDIYQGAAISNLLDGWPLFAAMDRMGYDAVALGNHEFDWGIGNTVDADATMPDYEWNGQSCMNSIPVVCANLYQNGTRVPFTKDYVIVEKTAFRSSGEKVKVKLGIIGFAQNYAGSIMNSKFIGQGYSIDGDVSIAENLARELESSGQCDASILLIHGGADAAAEDLSSGSPIDLVLGGHSHRSLSGTGGSGVPYLQGGRYGEHYAYADLTFTVADDSVSVSFTSVDRQAIMEVDDGRNTHETSTQNTNDLDEEVLAISDHALAMIEEENNTAIGYITTGATNYYISGSGNRCSAIGNWMCDITRRIGEADVSFVNGGGIRTSFPLDGQYRRDITVANVYEMFPFANTVYIYVITYEDLLQLFTYALSGGGKALFTCMTGFDCYFSGNDLISLAKDGTVIYEDGAWVGNWSSKTLTLAVSEYLATTVRTDYSTGMPNPLIDWNETSRLRSNTMVDNENAVRVLKEEAAESGGLLSIDTKAHFIEVTQQ